MLPISRSPECLLRGLPLAEMREVSGLDLEMYVYYGDYPGAATGGRGNVPVQRELDNRRIH